MTSESGRVSGSDDAGVSARIGTVERDQAIALLGEHWQAGRLDPGEHEHRVTKAKAAVTRADLDALFVDLPRTAVTQAPVDVSVVGSAGGADPVPRGFLEGNRDRSSR